MKNLFSYLALVACLGSLLISTQPVLAQGTAFTYQGQFQNNGSPANGNYDFTFALFNNSSTNTGQVGSPLTNLDVGVTNGLFTVTLDFGPVFTGNATWLAIGVRTNGGDGFTALNPLQELTPTPYATYAPNAGAAASANSVAGSNIVGTIAAGQLPPGILTNGENGVNITGAFTGDGSGLANLNGASLDAGTVSSAQLAVGALSAPVSIAGTSVAATPNTSYVATNASFTTLLLPGTANVGDVVTIEGAGAGGWQVDGPGPATWTQQTSAPSEDWFSVASSSDGTHLVAGVYGGGIYTSVNSGNNWTQQTNAPSEGWLSVASSSDGTHLVAVVDGGGIYTSVNSGTNWTQQTSAPSPLNWYSVASSSDGINLVAVVNSGGIYTYPSLAVIATGAQGASAQLAYVGNGQWEAVTPGGVALLNANQTFTGVNTFAGVISGNGAGLTNLNAANLTGALPAISGANLTSLNATNINNSTAANLTNANNTISGNGAGLTSLNAANLTGALPAISGDNLTSLNISALAWIELLPVGWGDNDSGETTIPAGLSNVVAIAAG